MSFLLKPLQWADSNGKGITKSPTPDSINRSLVHIFCCFKLRNYIVNRITMTRKSGENLCTTYGNTEQLFRPYEVSSAVYTVISTMTSLFGGTCVPYKLMAQFRVAALPSVVAGSIFRGGDQGIHCWWDLIWWKQLSSVSVCHAGFFGNSIHKACPI